MEHNKTPYVAAAVMNSVMWIGSSAAVIYTVATTKNPKALWGLAIPAVLGGYSVKSSRNESSKDGGES